ncbi:hypothetical protein LSH36_2940g00000 [Paralvinella palmiformis]|uniref:Lectin n=1 Tax=Paralvinella palmiformis TaxID=53620 RepID=A0AAD9ML28_9ANNE|nr:hypothetical protein LSH36_2940g00000 [Paralvinella palmiformis]
MSCADCTMWDQTQLTCVKDPSRNDCNDNTGSTGVKERITNIGFDKTHSVWTQLKPEMCITFETMTEASKFGFTESSVWIGNHGKNWDSEHVQLSTNDCIEGKKCAYFNGQSYLSVDTLANSFHTWKKFTISLWYKADHLGTMGLLTNGFTSNGCSSLPTITMTTTNGQLNSHVALKDKAAQFKGQVIPNEWNHVCLIRDDDVISMYVNAEMTDEQEIKGNLLPSQCSMMFGIGRNQAFFQGQMDKICLYKGALTEQQVIGEYVKLMPSDGYTGARFHLFGTGVSG